MSCIMQTPIFCSSCDLCIFCLALLQLATRQLNYDLKKKKINSVCQSKYPDLSVIYENLCGT